MNTSYVRMLKFVSVALAAAIAGTGTGVLGATAQQTATVTAQCTTDSTGGDGVRHACDSLWQTITAPAGYVLAKELLAGGLTSGNGSEKGCRVEFSDNIDVIPGVPQPRTVRLQAHARSPKGHFAGRGWAVCSYTIAMVALPK